MNTSSSNGLIMFTSLAEQDGGLLVEIYVYMYNVDPSRSWAQTPRLPSSCPWIPGSPIGGTCIYKLPRLQPHSNCWYQDSPIHSHLHTHPHTEVTGSWPGLLWSPVASPLLDTHTCTGLMPRDPRPNGLSTSLLGLPWFLHSQPLPWPLPHPAPRPLCLLSS